MKFLLIYIAMILVSCSSEEEIARLVKYNTETQADQIANNIRVEFIDSSKVKAILESGRARIFNEEKETLLDSNVKLTFMSRYTNDRISLLTCDSARIDDKTGNMFAFGNVVVVSDSTNTILNTEVLEYRKLEQKLYSTKKVRIENDFEIINGIGFESDLNLDYYKIYKVNGIKKKDE